MSEKTKIKDESEELIEIGKRLIDHTRQGKAEWRQSDRTTAPDMYSYSLKVDQSTCIELSYWPNERDADAASIKVVLPHTTIEALRREGDPGFDTIAELYWTARHSFRKWNEVKEKINQLLESGETIGER